MNSLKSTFVLALLLSVVVSLHAQPSFGLRAGVNIAKQAFDVEDGITIDPDNILGLTVAGVLELGITDNFAVQPELVFVQKGYKFDFDFLGEKVETRTLLNHFEVPVLAKYKFGGESIGAYVAAGPTFGYALSGYVKADDEKENIEGDDWDEYNRFELGASIGGGISFGSLFVDIRYLLGLSNLSKDSDNEGVKAHNRGIGLSIGYMF